MAIRFYFFADEFSFSFYDRVNFDGYRALILSSMIASLLWRALFYFKRSASLVLKVMSRFTKAVHEEIR